MKKHLGKKLTLNKETLRNLSEKEAGEVAGGITGPQSGDGTLVMSECILGSCPCGTANC